MKATFFGCLVLGVSLAAIAANASADEPRDQAINKDRKQIEGTWRIVALEANGNKARAEDISKLSVINGSDGSWRLHSDGREISKGTSAIDPSKQPKEIDFTAINQEGREERYIGIYELGEQTRRLCFVPSAKPRPTEFTSAPESQQILVNFERLKSEDGK